MKLVAKDFNNKTSILDAMISVGSQLIESPTINLVGIADAATSIGLRQLKFKLLPEDSTLEAEQLPYAVLEKTYCWTHAEARIENSENSDCLPWINVNILKSIMDTWSQLDEMLAENDADFEDYFYKTNTQKKSSYTLTRDELMLLLSLQGGQTLRQVVLSKETSVVDLLTMLFNSMSHKLLTKASYNPNADYADAIKFMGDRINILSKNATLIDRETKKMLEELFMHDLVLLTVKYPDTECIGVSGNIIDVSETVSALTLTKDSQYACTVGSSILKPLNILYASVASSLVWSFGFEQTVALLARTNTELVEKYKGVKSEKKTNFIRSFF